jgi:hypothetical protein
MPIRVNIADQSQADEVWRLLCDLPAGFPPVELHLDGHGLQWTATRSAAGLLTVLAPDGRAHTLPPADHA